MQRSDLTRLNGDVEFHVREKEFSASRRSAASAEGWCQRAGRSIRSAWL